MLIFVAVMMEVWFRSFSFLFMGDGCRFQLLIFQGVSPVKVAGKNVVPLPKVGCVSSQEGIVQKMHRL